MKQLDAAMRADPKYKGKKSNKVARELGLYSNRFDGGYQVNGVCYCMMQLISENVIQISIYRKAIIRLSWI